MQRTSFLNFTRRFYFSLTGLFLPGLFLLSLALAACGPSAADPASDNGSQPTGGLSGLSGDVVIDGSSTVFPISEAVAEEFGILTKQKVRITVGTSGTGGGFKKFCNSETQISNASRPIKGTEVALCSKAGIEFIEIPVAIDGITVIVNPANNFVDCMTVAELHTIWAPEAEGVITNWNQVRSSWPDENIDIYGPGVDSGTFDYFTETINNGTYAPLSRPLFIYVRKDAADIPQVREFVNYYLSDEGHQLVAEVGYIPLPDEVYDLALDRFQNAVTGTLFGGDNPQHGPVVDVLRGG